MTDKWLLFAACLYAINAVGWVVFIIWKGWL
jgi:uncharacterized membrane protein